ncbi:MAG: hypothetical protein IIA45_08695 [Bacteroidetes bacterium]|nr:hypothetical protein [Bacteroidota bacterium]
MSTKKHISLAVASVAMLCLFTGIITNNILCNFAHAVDATGQEHKHPYGHDHHHDGGNPIAEHDHKDKGHEHDQDSATNCCNDLTSTFFSNLVRDFSSGFKLDSKIISVTNLLSIFTNSSTTNNYSGVAMDSTHPPPKIPDIRVFIQSYQI